MNLFRTRQSSTRQQITTVVAERAYQHHWVLLAVALVQGHVSVMVTKIEDVSFQHLTKFWFCAAAGLPGKERPDVSLVLGAMVCTWGEIYLLSEKQSRSKGCTGVAALLPQNAS